MLFCFSLHKIEERALTLRRTKNQMLYYVMLPSVNCFLELSNTFRKKKRGGGKEEEEEKGKRERKRQRFYIRKSPAAGFVLHRLHVISTSSTASVCTGVRQAVWDADSDLSLFSMVSDDV